MAEVDRQQELVHTVLVHAKEEETRLRAWAVELEMRERLLARREVSAVVVRNKRRRGLTTPAHSLPQRALWSTPPSEAGENASSSDVVWSTVAAARYPAAAPDIEEADPVLAALLQSEDEKSAVAAAAATGPASSAEAPLPQAQPLSPDVDGGSDNSLLQDLLRLATLSPLSPTPSSAVALPAAAQSPVELEETPSVSSGHFRALPMAPLSVAAKSRREPLLNLDLNAAAEGGAGSSSSALGVAGGNRP